MPRKRKDPDEAPVDGDYSLDVVLNKQKGYTYKLLSEEDIPRFRAYGFTREDRGPDAAHPAFDLGANSDMPDYQVKGLTLYKAPDAIAKRLDSVSQRAADHRMAEIREQARASGGQFTTSTNGF